MIARRSVLLALGVAACASPEPRLHTLVAVPGAALPSRALAITLRRPVLPHYAERREIVLLDQQGGMKASQNDWWGEPPPDMVRRVLAADLAQRLPAAQVLAGDGIATDGATIELETEFQRFEPDMAGNVELSGFVGFTMAKQPNWLLKVQAQAASPGAQTSLIVAAMSQALGRAADQIAAGLGRWQVARVP